MQNISISDEFADKWPAVKLGCLECSVTVDENNSLIAEPKGDVIESNIPVLSGSFMPAMVLLTDALNANELGYLYLLRRQPGNLVQLVCYSLNNEMKVTEVTLDPVTTTITANTAMPAYMELSPDGQMLALTVHKGEKEPLYGLATEGVGMVIYQVDAKKHTLTSIRSMSLPEEQLVNSAVWDSKGENIYYTNTTVENAFKAHRVDPFAEPPVPFTYAEELSSPGTLQRGAAGNIYLAMAGATDLAQVTTDAVNFTAFTLGGDILAGALPAIPHKVSIPEVQDIYYRTLGNKQYELADHLGNVRATVSDRLFANADGTLYPQLLSANTYYPFGMGIKSLSQQGDYRFGFQGQEKDNEIKGEGNSYTAQFWQYDSRLGRRWNIDPIVKPWESSYVVFFGNPVSIIDPLGLDGTVTKDKNGNASYAGEALNGDGAVVNVTGMTNGQMSDAGYTALTGTGTYDKGTSNAGVVGNKIIRSSNNYWNSDGSTSWMAVNRNRRLSNSLLSDRTFSMNGKQNLMSSRIYQGQVDFINHKATKLMAGVVAAPFAVSALSSAYSAGLLTTNLTTSADMGTGLGSAFADWSGQMFTNGFQIREVNYTSVGASFVFKNIVFSEVFGSSLEYNFNDGYNGIGAGKSILQVTTESTVGIIFGTATNIPVSQMGMKSSFINNASANAGFGFLPSLMENGINKVINKKLYGK